MKARLVIVGMMLTAATAIAIPAGRPAMAAQKAGPCDCAKPQGKAEPKHHFKRVHVERHARRRAPVTAHAEGFYDYRSAAPVRMDEWHGEWHGVWHGVWRGQWQGEWQGEWRGEWRPATDDGYGPPPDGGHGPGPAGYGPPRGGYGEESGLTIDQRGWNGGVGVEAADSGYAYGYGYAPDRLNGPTYNSYGQSFQYNPSHAGPFRPRRMGGMAPPPRPGFGPR